MTSALWGAALLTIGFACQWIAWRVKLPAILFLLLAGIVLGPVTGLFDPDAALGDLLFPFVSLGVAIILFEGSLTLRFSEIRGLATPILTLISVGAAVSFAGLTAAAHYLAGLDWPMAALFGAIGVVTGPTVIIPMLRSVRPNARVANVLRWEGIIIDPIGALLAVLVFEAVALGHGNEGVWVFAKTVALGAGIGVVAALLLSYVLRRHFVPEYLQNYAALAGVLLAFAASDAMAEESGLLAVTVMGIVMANQKRLHIADILDFKEHLSTLLISMLFIVLAARLVWPSPAVLMDGLLLLAVAIVLIRPASVLLGTLGSNLSWRERALIAWIAPRGIVAAAVAALFALKLEAFGTEGARDLVPLVFLLIIGTVAVYATSARWVARWLGVANPDPRGVLIVGSSRPARMLGEALKKQDFEVLVADDDWWGIRAARMAGLSTYFGNPVSEHADRNLELIGIGRLLAMSTRRELNTLACVRYRPEFGGNHVFHLRQVAPDKDTAVSKAEFAEPLRAPRLFGEDISYDDLLARIEEGWVVKQTRLGESFDYDDFLARYGDPPLLLFAVTDAEQLRIANDRDEIEPKAGWTVTALVNPASRVEGEPKPAEQQPEAVAPQKVEPELPE